MKMMIYLKTSLILTFLLFASNCTDNRDSTPVECPPKIPVEEPGNFVLSLSLNKCFEDVKQTIFVESAENATGSNLFALGAKFKVGKYTSNGFEKVNINDIEIKRLAGDTLYLSEEVYHEYDKNKKIHKIEVTLDTINTNLSDDLKNPIKKIMKDEVIIVYVKYKGESIFTGPRICENYIGG